MLDQTLEQRRQDLAIDAAIKLGLGALFSGLAFGGLFMLFYLLLFFSDLTKNPGLFAALIALVFIAAATWSALGRVNPFRGLEPASPEDEARRVVARAISHASGDLHALGGFRRDSIAAYASILIEGPRLLVEGLARWRSRPAPNIDAQRAAEDTLERLADARPIDAEDPGGVALLLDLDLIRVEGRVSRESPATLFEIRPTAKGRRLRERA